MNILKMKTNTLNKIIFSVILVVTVLIFDIFAITTTNNQIDKIIEIKKEIITESATARNLSDTKKKISELMIIDERINSILIQEDKIVNFISMVEQQSEELGVSIRIQKVDFNGFDDVNNKQLGELEMNFQVDGTWQQVTNFLNVVESLPYVVNIESLRLSTANIEGVVGWTANFVLIGLTR